MKNRSSRPEVFCKKGVLTHRCFPGNFPKFLRPPFFTEHIWRLLLEEKFSAYQTENIDNLTKGLKILRLKYTQIIYIIHQIIHPIITPNIRNKFELLVPQITSNIDGINELH